MQCVVSGKQTDVSEVSTASIMSAVFISSLLYCEQEFISSLFLRTDVHYFFIIMWAGVYSIVNKCLFVLYYS
jgi:hypothetical protein